MLAIALAALLQVELLGSDDLEVREWATAELRRNVERAWPELVRALDSPDAEIRARAETLAEEYTGRLATSAIRVRLEPHDDRVVLRVKNVAPIRIRIREIRVSRAATPLSDLPIHSGLFAPGGRAVEFREALADAVTIAAWSETVIEVARLAPAPTDDYGATCVDPVCLWAAGESRGSQMRVRFRDEGSAAPRPIGAIEVMDTPHARLRLRR